MEPSCKRYEEAENLFIIGFSLPDTDIFFRYLFALCTVGETPLKKLWLFDPDKTHEVEKRYRKLLGPGAKSRFKPFQNTFEDAISIIETEFDDNH